MVNYDATCSELRADVVVVGSASDYDSDTRWPNVSESLQAISRWCSIPKSCYATPGMLAAAALEGMGDGS
jgi:hypothetical protein